jgi:hypothetical protein
MENFNDMSFDDLLKKGEIHDALEMRLEDLEMKAGGNCAEIEAAKISSAALVITGFVLATPVTAVFAGMGAIAYLYSVASDFHQTHKFALFPLVRKGVGDLLSGVGLAATGHSKTEDADDIARAESYLSPREAKEYRLLATNPDHVSKWLLEQPAEKRPLAYKSLTRNLGVKQIPASTAQVSQPVLGESTASQTAQSSTLPAASEATTNPTMAPYPVDPNQQPSQPIGNDTRLGAVTVPASPAGQSPATKPGFFDFNVLRTEPDNYTGFAIVGDMGTGKTRLIKYLARNVLTTGQMSVMDIYARANDWKGAYVLTTIDSFLCEAVNELDEIDTLTEAYRSGQTVFQPHLFVVEEAADTLSEASDRNREAAKSIKQWLSKYLTITRKIGKRLCLVSVNIKDLTDAIGSAEKRNSMVFIFPGKAAIAKAMTDLYIFKLGTSENADLRAKLEKAIASIKRPALIQHRGQWWAAEIPEVNEDGSLMDGSSPEIAATTQTSEAKTQPKTAPTPQDLERMFNAPSADHEIEEDAIESVSALDAIRSAFPNWKPKSQDVASKIVDWMASRSGKAFLPSEVKNSIRLLKNDKAIDNDRVKKLLDLLTEKQFLAVDESGRYSVSEQTDDYDF